MNELVLKYFKPQKNTIYLDDLKIRFLNNEEISSEYGKDFSESIIMTVPVLQELLKKQNAKNLEDFFLPVIEYSNDNIPKECIKALFDLAFNSWKYYLKRSDNSIHYINFVQKKLRLIEEGYRLLDGKENENKRFRISLQRWGSSYRRSVTLDSVLDCCSSLEALLSLSNELRLRLSLSVYHIVDNNKKKSMIKVYEMYGIRNNFIHGSGIYKISKESQIEYINIVAQVLLKIIKDGVVPKNDLLNKKILGK